jgi:hypothetical protein
VAIQEENQMGPSIPNSLARLTNNDVAGIYWLMKFSYGQAAIAQEGDSTLLRLYR